MATVPDENQYYPLRRKILTIDPLVKVKLLKRTQKRNSIIIHYKYENRYY